MGRGTITPADNGSSVPVDADSDLGFGFVPKGDFILTIRGGAAINATLQKYDPELDEWYTVIDPDGFANITAEWEHPVTASRVDRFRINIITVTGTWSYNWVPTSIKLI